MKKVLILSLVSLSLLTLVGCASETSVPPRPSLVVYEVTGSAHFASVTLTNGQGGTEQYGKVSIPWTYTDKAFSANFLYVSAQNLGAHGTITVSIHVNGKSFKTSSSSGSYVIATASGSRPQ